MSIKDLLIKDALAAQKMYDDWERNVGGPEMAKALRRQQQIDDAVARYQPLLAPNSILSALSGREALLQAVRRMQEDATGVDALRRALGAVDDRFALRELQRQVADLHTFESSFADALKTFRTEMSAGALWHQVKAVSEPWIALDDPYRSFEAFGALSELASLHDVSSDDDTEVDPRIEDIPQPAVRPLGRAAGLKIHEVEARIELGAPRNIGIVIAGTGTWGTEAHVQIQGVEVMLRTRLDAHMIRTLGPSWHKHRVAKPVLETWRSRQAEARVGRSDNLLDFATFGELRDVLIRGDVWTAISVDVDMTKEEFAVLLDHLMEIRHAVDHGRPLMRRHFVWCFADVDRILQAIGFDTPDED